MKYLGTITSGLDLVNKNYVDDNVPTKTSDLTNDSGFSSVSFTRYTTSGTNIADIEIDGTTTKIYAPTSGGGGVTDYDQLTSRPQVNSVTLTGNKSSSDLGVADEVHTHTKSDITDFPTITDEKVKNTKITPSNTPTTYYISGSQSSSTATEELVKSDIAAISVVNQNNHTAVALALGVNSNDTQGSITLNGYNGKSTVVQPNASASSYPTTITLPSTTGTVALTSDIPTKTSDLTNDSGFTSDYDDLSNRPQINSTTLTGNKTLSDLGMKSEILDIFYPVGSYYETSDTSFDPNNSWGGQWQLETEGQVHVSGSANGTYQINGATTDTNDAGSAQITYTPTGSNSAVTLSGAQSGVQAHAHTASASGGKVGSHAHEPSNTDYQFLAVAASGASVGRHTVGTSGTSSNSYIHTATAVARYNVTESVAPSFTQPTITVNNATAKDATKSHNHTFTGTQVQLDNMQPYIVVNRWHRTA